MFFLHNTVMEKQETSQSNHCVQFSWRHVCFHMKELSQMMSGITAFYHCMSTLTLIFPHHLEIRKSSRLKHTIFANYMNILNHSLNRPILWNANKNKSILLHNNEDMFFLHVHQPPAAPHSERMLDASPKKVLCSSPAGRMTTPPKGEVMHLPGMRLVDHNKQ